MKRLLISFIVLFIGLLTITQAPLLTSAAGLSPSENKINKLKSFTIRDVGLTSIGVSWKKHKFDGTQIRVMTASSDLVLKKNTKKRSRTTITGLNPGTTYIIKARAYDIRNSKYIYGKYSTTVTTQTDQEVTEDIEEENEQQEDGPVDDIVYICSSDYYNCSDFSSQAEAQTVHNYCVALGVGDIHGLDSDNDGEACESLN